MSQNELDRLQQENATLRAELQHKRAILASSVDFAIIATNPSGRVTNWNSGAEHCFGWSADEVKGETAERFFTPEDVVAGRVAIEMRLALEHGRASDERWHLRKDGSRFFASGEMMPLRGEANEHLGFLKIVRDLTEEHASRVILRDVEVR